MNKYTSSSPSAPGLETFISTGGGKLPSFQALTYYAKTDAQFPQPISFSLKKKSFVLLSGDANSYLLNKDILRLCWGAQVELILKIAKAIRDNCLLGRLEAATRYRTDWHGKREHNGISMF